MSLTSLALNNNFICKMEGLDNLYNLSILNLSHNKIEVVQGLEGLRKLETINLSTNFIVHPHALSGIAACENIHSIDLSHNEIENSEESFNQIILNKHVGCLYLKATPLARGFRNYRKKFIAALKNLKFLDDRPVLEKDHRLSEGTTFLIQPGQREGLHLKRPRSKKLQQKSRKRSKNNINKDSISKLRSRLSQDLKALSLTLRRQA